MPIFRKLRTSFLSALSSVDLLTINPITLGLTSLFISWVYFKITILTSLHNGLWADEVLSVSVAKMDSPRDIISALWHGSEYSPPTYNLFLHYFLKLTACLPDLLAERLLSILAVFGSGVLVFFIMRKHTNHTSSLLSAGIVLTTTPYMYAVQARPYGLLFFTFTCALFIWERIDSYPQPKFLQIKLWLALCLCSLLHFYGFFYVVALGICECLYSITQKKIRRGVIASILGTIPAMLSLQPLAAHISLFLKDDIPSQKTFHEFPGYPLFAKTVSLMVGIDGFWITLVHYGLSLTVLFYLIRRLVMGWGVSVEVQNNKSQTSHPDNLEIVMIALLAMMAFAFVFVYFVTQSFAPRYVLGAALFPAFFAGYITNKLHDGKIIALLLLIIILPHEIKLKGAVKGDDSKIASRQDVLPFLKDKLGNSDLPIVIDSPDFLALSHGADTALKPRITYLLTPEEGVQPNAPSDRQVKRFADIFPTTPVYDFNQFVANHSRFYIVTFNPEYTPDSIAGSLNHRNLLGPISSQMREAFIHCAGTIGVKRGCATNK